MRHLIRLYPKRWRDRYAHEITALVQREPASVRGVLDLLRSAIDARLHPGLAQQLVFVPTIGFRPAGTRVLFEPAVMTNDDTQLTILAVAATPDATELTVEWERTSDPAACLPVNSAPRPDLPPPSFTTRSTSARTLSAFLEVGAERFVASHIERTAFDSTGFEVRTMTFPPLPDIARAAALIVDDGARHWRVALTLAPARLSATGLAVSVERDGIIVRATAVARHGDELVIGLEVEAPGSLRGIGSPPPVPPLLPTGRKFKVPATLRAQFDPISIEDPQGERHEEVRRIFAHDRAALVPGQPFVQRFSVAFNTVSVDTATGVLTVPFIEVNHLDESATVDLRELPCDVRLGEHGFRVLRAEQYGAEERRVVLEVAPSAGSPHFVQPASIRGVGPGSYSWGSSPERGEPVWMATTVGDPPIVTFRGTVLRYDGPWRLNVPLA